MAIPRAGIAVVFLACAGYVAGQGSFSMPSWLEPYPGATAKAHTFSNFISSSYQTSAPPEEVVGHYKELFTAAGLPFFPHKDPITISISGSPPECNVLIQIRKFAGATQVNVTCSAVLAHKTTEADVIRSMEKFDQPVYPTAPPRIPPLTWPSWLGPCDGAPVEVHTGVDRFKLNYMKAEFTSSLERAAIQSFYADLLNSHGYPVSMQSSPITPRDRTALVEGARYFSGPPGPRFAIRVELVPAADGIHVELRITEHH
jgi:hypothetical protein